MRILSQYFTSRTGSSVRQRGVVLVVTLIVLVLVSILGVSSVRNVTFQERMTGQALDRNIAFQAAEAALREGETLALAQSQATTVNADFPSGRRGNTVDTSMRNGLFEDLDPNSCNASPCADGLCSQPDLSCTPRWFDPAVSWRTATTALGFGSGNAPQFIVEFLGDDFACDPGNPLSSENCSHYRITARGQPGDGRADVLLQSVYMTE